MLPEVRAATVSYPVPLGDSWSSSGPIIVEGQAPPAPGGGVYAGDTTIGVGFFETLGIPLVRGRDFTERDREGAPDVVIVNETLARQLFPGEDPIGKRFRLDEQSTRLREIVGVARDGKYRSLGEEPRSFMFLSHLQSYNSEMMLVVNTRGSLGNIAERVRGEVNKIDARMPIYNIKTMDEHIDFALWGPRTAATLAATFGVLALALAVLGLFGVMSYTVAQRTREFGIRRALGATSREVLQLVLGGGLRLIGAGVALGLIGAMALRQTLTAQLFQVATFEMFALMGVGVLATAGVLACVIPAVRATRLEALEALQRA